MHARRAHARGGVRRQDRSAHDDSRGEIGADKPGRDIRCRREKPGKLGGLCDGGDVRGFRDIEDCCDISEFIQQSFRGGAESLSVFQDGVFQNGGPWDRVQDAVRVQRVRRH